MVADKMVRKMVASCGIDYNSSEINTYLVIKSQIIAKLTEEPYRGYSGSGIDEKIILSVGAGLIDRLMILSVPFYSYHFVRTILSIPFCPMTIDTFCPYATLSIPFCPYHFVRYHFVLEPS